jgi:hypothetical protein
MASITVDNILIQIFQNNKFTFFIQALRPIFYSCTYPSFVFYSGLSDKP